MRILVVDTETRRREGLCAILQKLGHETVQAAVCHKALELIYREQFDAVVTELVLCPGDALCGRDVVHQALVMDIKHIVLISESPEPPGEAHVFLLKPITLEALGMALADPRPDP